MANEQKPSLPHKLSLTERKELSLTGVTEVISFDDTAIVLRTGFGNLVIQGQDLHLKTLSPEGGHVDVDGQISSVIYEEPRTGGWMRRLLG